MSKAKGNKYAGLINAVEDNEATKPQDTQIPKSQDNDIQKSRLALLKEGKMKQLKAVIPNELHLRLRIAVLKNKTDISEVLEPLIIEWLEANE